MISVEPHEALADCQRGLRPAGLVVTVATRLLDFYHALVAPILTAHSGSACRFDPSCSRYATMALDRHGLWRGGYLVFRRLARCRPWGGYGYDPVPPAEGDN
jgi:uncharacterized protein